MFVFSKPVSAITNQNQIIENTPLFCFSKPESVMGNHLQVKKETGGMEVATRVPTATQSLPTMTPDMAKDNCKNYLTSLLSLTRDRYEESVARNVKALIQSLIDGRMATAEFHAKLRKELSSSPPSDLFLQKGLLYPFPPSHFIQKGLQYLQHSLATRELSIEGVLPPTINQVCQNSKDDACQTFQDILIKSKTIEMNKEIEEKKKTFQKLEEQKIEIIKKITEYKHELNTNTKEYEDRKSKAQKKETCMDLEIAKAKITLQNSQNDLAKKEKNSANWTRMWILDGQETGDKNNKIRQEIGSLKRKKISIEKEQDELPKKQKVNEDLVKHISKAIDAKMKDLECPVCFYTAEGFIYQCTGGHLICKECLPSLKLCPECRTKYPKNPFRNRFAEKIGEEIKTLSEERKELLDGI